MSRIKKINIIIGTILLLLVVLGFVFARVYEGEVKKIILSEINKKVLVPIDVEDIHFSVFKKFPYASLEFNNVKINAKNEANQLANIESIFLQFNIIDILNKKYRIKKISIENGTLALKINKKGSDNFHIFKPSNEDENETSVVELKSVSFKNITVYYLNDVKQTDGSVLIQKLNFSGNFSDNVFSMETNASFLVEQLNNNKEQLLKNKNIKLSTEFNVNRKKNLFTIKSGNLQIEKMKFNLLGNFISKEDALIVDVLSGGSNLSFEDLFSLFPAQQKSMLKNYTATGEISYKTTIKGELSLIKTPIINADFVIKGANLEENESNYQLSNINLTGNFTNGINASMQSSKLSINNLNATFGAGSIAGNYIVSNFDAPYIELQTQANVDLEMAKRFFKLDSIEVASGNVLVDLKYSGYVKNIQQIKAAELQKLNAQGNAQLKNVQLKLKNNFYLTNANGYFRFNDNEINVDSITTIFNNSPIFVKGKFNNLLAYIFAEKEWLAINATFKSTKFSLDDFITKDEVKKQEPTYEITLPKRVMLNLATQIDTFTFRKFKASHFKGNILLEDNTLSATDVSFKTMNGNVIGNIALDYENASNVLITCSGLLNNIDITELFYQFENLGQSEIDAKNLKGSATISFQFASVLTKKLEVQKDKIYLSSTVSIAKGELINYEPIMELSKFIAVEDLQHIKFNQLTTQIEVINETISISKTAIYSSAIDLTVAGKHTFNNTIDYRFKVMLNDILWNKAKNKNKNEEFGYEEDDGLGKTALFLKMTGTTENYKISYDTEELKSTWKENVKEEKTTLKTILNKEFGWFKKDSLSHEKEKKNNGLKIEWEEENKPKTDDETTKNKKPTNEKEKKGLRKFLDKIAQPTDDEFE